MKRMTSLKHPVGLAAVLASLLADNPIGWDKSSVGVPQMRISRLTVAGSGQRPHAALLHRSEGKCSW